MVHCGKCEGFLPVVKRYRRLRPMLPEPAESETSKPPPPEPAGTTSSAPRREIGGRDGPEPTRYGDWEKDGRCIDF